MYCEKCGGKTVEKWTGYFDAVTGQKKMKQVCPINDCHHNGHNWGRKSGWFQSKYSTRTCKTCGYESGTYLAHSEY